MAEIIRKNKIFDILKIHLKYILIVYVLAMFGSIIFYVVSPKYYLATTEILKPVKNFQTNVSSEVILSLLNSNGMQDKIIKKFKLSDEYGTENLDVLRRDFKTNVKISEVGKKIIKIDVIDKNPETAADIANFFYKNLNNLIYNLINMPTVKNRIAIEENLTKTDEQIKSLEYNMDKIEHKNKIIIINNSNKDLSPVADYLMTKLIKEKLELDTIKQTEPINTKKLVDTRVKIAYLESQIDKIIKYKRSLLDIQRDISEKETLFSLLTDQLEKAKFSESKNIVPIQVLDKAIAPTTVYKPDIKIIVIIISCIILGIGLIVIFFDALRFLGSL
ncbi:MAG: hypothetical protein M1135_02815 [Candidatus Omnitrophica bacterium]|nr:hypothetical protein [Candidatus Omnitrophota bacterium]